MSGKVFTLFVAFCLLASVSGQSSLLEMSQRLWTKLVSGGLSKVGSLDPLKVPVIKVDQSEADTIYRIILKNVEIIGLNNSTLDSIHIARGRLKSNLSELEAGYVSYSDLRDLDSIRYRFHTLVKEPKVENETFEAIVSATNQETKFKAEPPMSRDSRLERIRQYDPFLLKLHAEQMKQGKNEEATEKTQTSKTMYSAFNMGEARVHTESGDTRIVGEIRSATGARPIYPQRAQSSTSNTRFVESDEDVVDCRGACQTRITPERIRGINRGYGDVGTDYYAEERYADAKGDASENIETRFRSRFNSQSSSRSNTQHEAQRTATRLENRPGYIDIEYADGKSNGSLKRFGNLRVEPNREAKVYSLEDVMKDIRSANRFIIHNFTEGESLRKRNDAIKTALEAKRIKDLIRYAKNYQEKEGYFEEGMQLVYHYGGMESKGSSDKPREMIRSKRAHKNDDAEDDVMHVILRIRVPLLQVKSDYELMGRVGNEPIHGTGKFKGNFTELIGDFTLELKKVDQNMLIVRAARSKLEAGDQEIDLQGMDEKGPVSSVLKHGLMAAEAVAAMLADDLATKALSEKSADAMIYRMYKNLPPN